MKVLPFFLLTLIFLHNGFCIKSNNFGGLIKELSIGVTTDCGIANSGETRILNGDDTESHEFPWVLSIQAKFLNNVYIHICGGSVVHPSWVITAAYCINELEIDTIRIVAGVDQLSLPEDSEQIRYIEEYFLNDYNSNFHKNDITLIRLDKDLELDGLTVAPICLPEPKDKFDSDHVIVAGWGLTKNGFPQFQEVPLQKATLSILPFDQCQARYQGSGFTEYVSGCNVCTAGGEHEPCTDDTGGPVMISDGEKYFLWGIIGFYNCESSIPGFPGLQTNVSCFADWIEETIKDN